MKSCICSPNQILKYQKRVSGPLLDRIDIHIEVPRVKYEKLADEKVAEESARVRSRVEKARKIQIKRQKKTNSELSPRQIKDLCGLDSKSKDLLRAAMSQLNLSARQYTRVLKLARTIADLGGMQNIDSGHIAEALQYRPKEHSIY
jgi:magnesium chelatase family protein